MEILSILFCTMIIVKLYCRNLDWSLIAKGSLVGLEILKCHSQWDMSHFSLQIITILLLEKMMAWNLIIKSFLIKVITRLNNLQLKDTQQILKGSLIAHQSPLKSFLQTRRDSIILIIHLEFTLSLDIMPTISSKSNYRELLKKQFFLKKITNASMKE